MNCLICETCGKAEEVVVHREGKSGALLGLCESVVWVPTKGIQLGDEHITTAKTLMLVYNKLFKCKLPREIMYKIIFLTLYKEGCCDCRNRKIVSKWKFNNKHHVISF